MVLYSEFLGKSKASIPMNRAEEPELTYKQCFLSNNLEILFSNLRE